MGSQWLQICFRHLTPVLSIPWTIRESALAKPNVARPAVGIPLTKDEVTLGSASKICGSPWEDESRKRFGRGVEVPQFVESEDPKAELILFAMTPQQKLVLPVSIRVPETHAHMVRWCDASQVPERRSVSGAFVVKVDNENVSGRRFRGLTVQALYGEDICREEAWVSPTSAAKHDRLREGRVADPQGVAEFVEERRQKRHSTARFEGDVGIQAHLNPAANPTCEGEFRIPNNAAQFILLGESHMHRKIDSLQVDA